MVYLFLSIVFIALDQFSKRAAVIWLKPISNVPLIKNVFELTYTTNTGASFGMFAGNSRLLGIFSLIACIAIFIYGLHEFKEHPHKRLYLTSLTMIFAGAAGNMIDRLLMGYVVDFFDFALINFAIFNVADSFICVGAVLLICVVFFDKELFGSGNGAQ